MAGQDNFGSFFFNLGDSMIEGPNSSVINTFFVDKVMIGRALYSQALTTSGSQF